MLVLLEGLLSTKLVEDDAKQSIDINTNVAVLISSKIPQMTLNKLNDPNDSFVNESKQPDDTIKIVDLKFKMKTLVKSFLNQNFTHNQLVDNAKELVANDPIIVEPKTPTNSTRSFSTTKSPKDLFSFYARKYFHSYNGIRVVLNECATNLTYLNVYRKNHLKQLFQYHTFHVNTNTSQTIPSSSVNSSSDITTSDLDNKHTSNNKSLSFNLIEEALQAKSNCANLMNDLDLFLKAISLSVFSDHMDTNKENDDESNEIEQTFRSQLDKKFVEQLTHLVLASQIATIITCSSDLILHQQHLTSQESNSASNLNKTSNLQHQLSNENSKADSLCLTRKSVN